MHENVGRRAALLLAATLLAILLPSVARGDADVPVLLGDTGVLLDQTAPSSGSGATSSTSTMTNIFAPPAYVDYKRTGSEPVVTVDRYPYPLPTSGDLKTLCPGGTTATACYKDIAYVDATEGFAYPGYDFFWSSQNLGQTFHLAHNDPTVGGRAIAQGRGGGDGYQAVGDVSHGVFFIDLPATNVTMNVSRDGGDSFTPDESGSAFDSGSDDRQWDAVDETAPLPAGTTGNVYISFIDITPIPTPGFSSNLVVTRSTHDGAAGSFVTDSNCTKVSAAADHPDPTTGPIGDNVPTQCPDPVDPTLSVAGPVVVDKSQIGGSSSHPHRVYVPFLRCTPSDPVGGLLSCGPPYKLYIARSDDGGTTWVRRPLCAPSGGGVCLTATQYPRNIFVQMTVDRAGNLYYTWAQSALDASGNPVGETDVYYAYSQTGGDTWSAPINLTPEANKSAVWPWIVAGDPGQVDVVYYKSNTGQYPAQAVGAVWNVYWGHSNNALNTGANFNTVQISDHPNHIGPICQSGLGCSSGRTLGDFFTMDVDHLGAANVVWADDNNSRGRTFIKFSRQISGNSVFKNTSINLMNTWPIKDHSVTDAVGDVITPTASKGTSPSCSSLDVEKMDSTRSGDLLTVNLTLAAPPAAASATTCATAGELPAAADGGFWGAEWWSSADTDVSGSTGPDNFYLAYIDQAGASPRAEAGRLNRSSFPSLTGNEPKFVEDATLGGNCTGPLAPSPCTLTLTASMSGLGIKSGAGLYSLSGESLYITGNTDPIPFTNVEKGYSSLGDTTAAIDYAGTGTTP